MKDGKRRAEQELTPPSEVSLNPFSDGLAIGAASDVEGATNEAKQGEHDCNNTGALWHNREPQAHQ